MKALELADKWINADKCQLQSNGCTRLHKLADAMAAGDVINFSERKTEERHLTLLSRVGGVFVAAHDWLAALDGICADAQEINTPYEQCAFEFVINGTPCIVITVQIDAVITAAPFACFDGEWVVFEGAEAQGAPVLQFAWAQVVAIVVGLDAGVAAPRNVEAPVKLNSKRARNGLCPLFNYSVVDLAKRHRASQVTAGTSHSKKRLHFRRGHWRHYQESKTWIKWMLVGDPSLGFIDHHYRV